MSSTRRSLLIISGLLFATLGAALTVRPFDSLDTLTALATVGLLVMALIRLLDPPRPWPVTTRLVALTWVASAIGVGSQPDIELGVLAALVGATVLIDGAAEVFLARHRTGIYRWSRVTIGLTGSALGLLILGWPDITVLIVAILFGIRVLWAGLTLAWTGVRGTYDDAEPFEAGSLRGIPHAVGSSVGLAVAIVLGTVSYYQHEAKPIELGELTIPAVVPQEPGKLISAERFNSGVPRGASAWRLLYTTTRDEGQPAVSSAIIIVGSDRPDGPRPVLAWAHGTTGIAAPCAPSANPTLLLFGAVPGLADVLEKGWAVVATDYIGLGTPGPHPYLIGQGEGRSVLDSVRAAREFSELSLSDETVVWGHSQGGGAALWAGILAEDYAPEVGLVGVAGIAPASDLVGLVDNITQLPTGSLFAAYVLEAYSQEYADVDAASYLQPGALDPMRQAAQLCVADFPALARIAQDPAFSQGLYARSASTGPLGKRLRQNTPSGPISAPTLIVQGELDPLVLPEVQADYVAARCAEQAGGPLDYRTYPGREHVNIIAESSAMVPDLIAWTQDRFDGVVGTTTC